MGIETYLFSLVVPPQREWARAGWYWRSGTPVRVASIPENVGPFGCSDMAGNIWEWCEDVINPARANRVLRGASFSDTEPMLLVRISSVPSSGGVSAGDAGGISNGGSGTKHSSCAKACGAKPTTSQSAMMYRRLGASTRCG